MFQIIMSKEIKTMEVALCLFTLFTHNPAYQTHLEAKEAAGKDDEDPLIFNDWPDYFIDVEPGLLSAEEVTNLAKDISDENK